MLLHYKRLFILKNTTQSNSVCVKNKFNDSGVMLLQKI
jgi:hypothetical protein